MNFSILMSVYKNTNINEMQACMDSLLGQTVLSNDIVIVIDGPIDSELRIYLEDLQKAVKEVSLHQLDENVGLGKAFRFGMEKCVNEIIARMDTDDIAIRDRFEKQLKCFEDDDELSIVGGNIAEFIGSKENIVSYRNVPNTHAEICQYMKDRCPFNHMAVMFKKSEVEKAGGYQHFYYNEDSYLWVRMFLVGCKFYNIQEILVLARINNETFMRRSGKKYYNSERDLFKFKLENKIITKKEYRKSMFKRYIVYRLMTNRMRQWAFKKFARDN